MQYVSYNVSENYIYSINNLIILPTTFVQTVQDGGVFSDVRFHIYCKNI